MSSAAVMIGPVRVNLLLFLVLVRGSINFEFDPIALRKAKIVCNFGLSECSRVNLLDLFCDNAQARKTIHSHAGQCIPQNFCSYFSVKTCCDPSVGLAWGDTSNKESHHNFLCGKMENNIFIIP